MINNSLVFNLIVIKHSIYFVNIYDLSLKYNKVLVGVAITILTLQLRCIYMYIVYSKNTLTNIVSVCTLPVPPQLWPAV